MSDIDTLLNAIPRIQRACRQRSVADPDGGRPVSAHQAHILGHLDTEDPAMVTELAEYLGVTPSTMSLTLKRLEAAGYVSRDRDPSDRRVINVRLTEAGRRTRDARKSLDPERVAGVLAMLDPEARERAVDGLAALAEAADALVRRSRETLEAQTGGAR